MVAIWSRRGELCPSDACMHHWIVTYLDLVIISTLFGPSNNRKRYRLIDLTMELSGTNLSEVEWIFQSSLWWRCRHVVIRSDGYIYPSPKHLNNGIPENMHANIISTVGDAMKSYSSEQICYFYGSLNNILYLQKNAHIFWFCYISYANGTVSCILFLF